jgi:hypothetical protein
VVDDPFRVFVEERGAWMDVDLLVVGNSAVTFLRVFTACMREETGTNGLTDPRIVLIGESTTTEER